jgi:hypothetical protein
MLAAMGEQARSTAEAAVLLDEPDRDPGLLRLGPIADIGAPVRVFRGHQALSRSVDEGNRT